MTTNVITVTCIILAVACFHADGGSAAIDVPTQIPASVGNSVRVKRATDNSTLTGNGGNPTRPSASDNDTSSDIAGAVIDGIEAVDRVGQRIKKRLDRVQASVDVLMEEKINAYGDLFRSFLTTGSKIPVTGLRLGLATLRLPLNIVG